MGQRIAKKVVIFCNSGDSTTLLIMSRAHSYRSPKIPLELLAAKEYFVVGGALRPSECIPCSPW